VVDRTHVSSRKNEKEKIDMEIMKVKNYKVFAENLRKKTGCEVTIKIMNSKDHYHFQLNKDVYLSTQQKMISISM